MSLWRRIIAPAVLHSLHRQEINKKCLHGCIYKNINITSNAVIEHRNNLTYNIIRYKSKKAQYESDEEEDDIKDDDSSLTKDSKVIKFSTTSMRTDIILKSALSISRNKVEQLFYESKIRINGKKILKKSASVKIGDEVDVIKMVSPKNPDHLYVARVEVLNVTPKEESISISARRFKNLLIENYEDAPHKVETEND